MLLFVLFSVAACHAEWYKSEKAGGSLHQSGGEITWSGFNKAHSGTNSIGTNLPKHSLSKKGDTVELEVKWKSSYKACQFPSKYWTESEYQYECAKHDVQMVGASSCPPCLAGTGDFRIFVGSSLHSLKDKFSLPGYKTSNRDFKGYEFRVFPHSNSKAHYYVPAKGSPRPGSSVVPTNICFGFEDKRVWPSESEKKTSFGGYDLSNHTSSHFKARLERRSSTEIEVTFEMHSHSYSHSVKHHSSEDLPTEVNAIIINYPNERGYVELKLSELIISHPTGPPFLNTTQHLQTIR